MTARITVSLSDALAAQVVEAAQHTAGGDVSTWMARAAELVIFRESMAGLRHEPLSAEDEAKLRAWLEWQNASAAAEGTDQQAA